MKPTVLFVISLVSAVNAAPNLMMFGAQSVNLWRLESLKKSNRVPSSGLLVQESNWLDEPPSEFEPQWFRQPLDHFTNTSQTTFLQRYWVNSRHYIPGRGGPVIILDGGETSGTDRLPFLDTGIVEILAKATAGLGVVLEHRYYGT